MKKLIRPINRSSIIISSLCFFIAIAASQAPAISLESYAKENTIVAEEIEKEWTALPSFHRRDPINNLKVGEYVVVLSNKRLKDINGISRLKVKLGKKMVPITSIKTSPLFGL